MTTELLKTPEGELRYPDTLELYGYWFQVGNVIYYIKL